MKNKFSILLSTTLLLTLFSLNLSAQLTEEVKKKTPDLPGQLMIDFGFNLVMNEPAEMPYNWFRSKSLGSVIRYFPYQFAIFLKVVLRLTPSNITPSISAYGEIK